MNSNTFRKYVDSITTVLVVAIFLTVAGIYLHNRFFKKQVNPLGSTIAKESRIADAFPIEYKTHSRTLILALDKDCVYCERSVGFYKRLLDLPVTDAGNTQFMAVLSNDAWDTEQYLRKEGLERLPHLANIPLRQLKITVLPTLILVDRLGRVLESWSGELDDERQRQVVEAISNRSQPAAGRRLNPTFNLFDETKPTQTTQPDSVSVQNIKDVDAEGYIYVQNGDQIDKRTIDGAVVEKIPVPAERGSGKTCAGSDGDVHFVMEQKIITSRRNGGSRVFSENRLPYQISPVTARYDAARRSIFILSDSTKDGPPKHSELVLYKFNLGNGELSEIHRAQLPIVYNYAIGLCRINYAIGRDKLFVSDPTEYKIYVYSLENNSLLTTFTQPFERPLIGKADGKLESLKLNAEDLTQRGALDRYPAIFGLDYVSSKNLLLVWTSIRNSSHEQMIDVFDSDLRPLGRDFLPTEPLFSKYHFIGDRVIVPDYGFGKEFHLEFLSPLELAYYKPSSLKTFQLVASKQ